MHCKHYFSSNSSTMATPRVKITERKLHRHNADGLAWVGGGLVELDPRMTERYRLEVLVHELLHHMHPEWVEEEVGATVNGSERSSGAKVTAGSNTSQPAHSADASRRI